MLNWGESPLKDEVPGLGGLLGTVVGAEEVAESRVGWRSSGRAGGHPPGGGGQIPFPGPTPRGDTHRDPLSGVNRGRSVTYPIGNEYEHQAESDHSFATLHRTVLMLRTFRQSHLT